MASRSALERIPVKGEEDRSRWPSSDCSTMSFRRFAGGSRSRISLHSRSGAPISFGKLPLLNQRAMFAFALAITARSSRSIFSAIARCSSSAKRSTKFTHRIIANAICKRTLKTIRKINAGNSKLLLPKQISERQIAYLCVHASLGQMLCLVYPLFFHLNWFGCL